MILAYVDVMPILFILGVLVLLLGIYIFCRIKKKKGNFGKYLVSVSVSMLGSLLSLLQKPDRLLVREIPENL